MKFDKSGPQKKPDKDKREPRQHHTLEQILRGIAESSGSTRSIAMVMGVSRQTVYDWKEKYPEVGKAMDEAKKDFLDLLQDKFRDKVMGGDTASIIFGLKCLGKHLGYVEKVEIHHQGAIAQTKTAEELTDDELASIAASHQRGGGGNAPQAPVRPA